ncbi:hypothetical protein ACFT30_06580 [Microbacterium ureisolvens]|uniref:hypothetical protein n=1 Tax=Microbacterium ureisolvens TaxID=2781186 RepID=UPI00362A206E
MPRHPSPLPSELGDVFSVADALGAGVSRNRLRAKDVEAPFHGTRVKVALVDSAAAPAADAPPSRWDLARRAEAQKAAAFGTVMTPPMFLAGRTAAVLQGGAIDPGPDLVVGVFAPSRAPRYAGVRGIKVSPTLAHVHTHNGLRMTTPATTWAMLAGELTVRELVVLGDSIVRVPRDDRGVLQHHRALAGIEQLHRATHAGRRAGVGKLREALPLIRVGSASPLETEFRLDAMAAGLPDPELDVEIRDRRGGLLGISEVVYRSAKVVVEIEGDHHRTDRVQWNRDIHKYIAYAAAGWEVVRLTSAHIRGDGPRAAEIVRAALLRRGWERAFSLP